jgi:hypothetical protein
MRIHFSPVLPLILAVVLPAFLATPAPACCAVPPLGMPVVNADQTVIIIWDAATKTEHFIRKASFKSAAGDFGFLVPTPTQPQLEESGNEAFPYLQKLTEPEIVRRWRPTFGIGCAQGMHESSLCVDSAPPPVQVRVEKEVAGFHAVVLETRSSGALVNWLKEHGYAFSPEVEAWAKPYVETGWMITALKVAKPKEGKDQKDVNAAALRMSFQTERPLFPYREPDSKNSARALGAQDRLLRIYFLAEARYRGELTRDDLWTGKVAWANRLKAQERGKVLELLRLPRTTGPAEWWLTEFEDHWPYRIAPADLYFARDSNQVPVKRLPIIQYFSSRWPTDVTVYAVAGVIVLPPLIRRVRRRRMK